MSFMEETTGELSQRFKRFASLECHGSSPLYEKLSLGISRDRELLQLASHSRHGPIPNLFLATVHFLLLKENKHALRSFYPDLESECNREDDPYGAFRAFCLENRGRIETILETRMVQTNEVQRSAVLMPAFQLIARATEKPLALIEIGTSAGLNLLWDKFGYDYGVGEVIGDLNSEVRIRCELRAALAFNLNPELPATCFRVGIDLNPLDTNNEEDRLWLKALIWPEHIERMHLLEAAMNIARRNPPRLVRGDALEILPNALSQSPMDSIPCVVSTFTLNQFSSESREKLELLLTQEAKRRELHFVYIEYVTYSPGIHPELHAVLRTGDKRQDRLLGKCEPHGEWLEWLA